MPVASRLIFFFFALIIVCLGLSWLWNLSPIIFVGCAILVLIGFWLFAIFKTAYTRRD